MQYSTPRKCCIESPARGHSAPILLAAQRSEAVHSKELETTAVPAALSAAFPAAVQRPSRLQPLRLK